MTKSIYGMTPHNPQKNYFADIRHPCGGSSWTHIRTNLGRKTAFAMIAKQYSGCKIEGFRDDVAATKFDRQALAQK